MQDGNVALTKQQDLFIDEVVTIPSEFAQAFRSIVPVACAIHEKDLWRVVPVRVHGHARQTGLTAISSENIYVQNGGVRSCGGVDAVHIARPGRAP